MARESGLLSFVLSLLGIDATTTFREVMQGPASPPPASEAAVRPGTGAKCSAPITPDDVFCGVCGNKLK